MIVTSVDFDVRGGTLTMSLRDPNVPDASACRCAHTASRCQFHASGRAPSIAGHAPLTNSEKLRLSLSVSAARLSVNNWSLEGNGGGALKGGEVFRGDIFQ